MKKSLIILTFCLLLSTSFVAAQISISEPYDTYNLGDKVYITADGLRGSESGNLNMGLVCGNLTTNVLKISARAFSTDQDQSYSIPYKILTEEDLEITNIKDIIGSCRLSASLGENTASSKTFTISDEISVTPTLDKINYNPGEEITLTINATKANGKALNGFLEVKNATEFTKEVEGGSAIETFTMSETAEAGSYTLMISAYDTNKDGDHLNIGNTTVFFKINQIATRVSTSLSKVEVIPGENLTIGSDIFDQSEKEMPGTVSLIIISPEDEEILKTIQSQETISIDFPTNATEGLWKIHSTFSDLEDETEFEIMELQKAEFHIEGGVLRINNIGNVPYNKTVSIKIGETISEISLNIKEGKEKNFNLEAPDGEYTITVEDGETNFEGSVLLTGNAISVKDLETVGIFTNYSVVWIFLIIILGATGVILFFRYRKKGKIPTGKGKIKEKINGIKEKINGKIPARVKSEVSNTMNFTNKSPKVQGLDDKNYHHEDDSMLDLTKKKISSAESTLVLKGEKNQSAVIAISIKNNKKLNDNSKNTLIEAINKMKEAKGLVDWREDHIFIVFSPLATKTFHNEELASKAAFNAWKKLIEHNKKFNEKIEFNIGVHSGELVASKEGGKLKYTGIGNTIALARRISDSNKEKILISDDIRKKMLRDLKVHKEEAIGKHQIYSISEIKNKEANQAKLKELLKRMED
ncbi:hypothetical protein HOA55_04345 [archaeon]|jgi:hypothetical protein|nr:hypothetical protein [archaeon]MBT3577956.1 hypothetical protein [archaeon]MBT6820559.1 hypothetical protein [archaeon]MBT6955928.1 hypothetical protein [archaeon]MBT7025810.1 hypothetical protein [archaeon]